MKFIFIDSFALNDFTRDHFDRLRDFLLEQRLLVVISSLQLVEYFSPVLSDNDRTNRAVQLLMDVPFVLINQSDVYEKEEQAYPNRLGALPYRLNGSELLRGFNPEEKKILLLKMFHEGVPEADFHLREWADVHRAQKDWPEHALAIITNAINKGTIDSKVDMLQSLDLRFCIGMLSALENSSFHDAAFKENAHKLFLVDKNKDSWIMSGIHLSSLIFWYDYIIAKKRVNPSDEADILYAMIFPYCDMVVVDNSRADCLEKIQRLEPIYRQLKCYNKKAFLKILLK
jgi:hypothetical protein